MTLTPERKAEIDAECEARRLICANAPPPSKRAMRIEQTPEVKSMYAITLDEINRVREQPVYGGPGYATRNGPDPNSEDNQ